MSKKQGNLRLGFVPIPEVKLAALPAMPVVALALAILPLPVRLGVEAHAAHFIDWVLASRMALIEAGKWADLADRATDTEMTAYLFGLSLIEPLSEIGCRAVHRAAAGMLREIGDQFPLPEQFARQAMTDPTEVAQYECLARNIRQEQLKFMRDQYPTTPTVQTKGEQQWNRDNGQLPATAHSRRSRPARNWGRPQRSGRESRTC